MTKNTVKTILLVEDEAFIAMSEKRLLEQYGYVVKIASSGEAAVESVKTSSGIDLVLMDINLGKGMDGTQAAELILIDRDIPIIFVSSHSEREVVEKTEKITSYGYVVKSSSITVLDASIKMAFKLFDEKEKSKSMNDRLEATFEALPDLLFEVGLDGYYYDSHSSKNELLYKPLSDLLGKYITDILPAEISDIIMSAIAEAHEKGISLGKQYELTVPTGIRSFEITVSRIASFPDRPHFILLCHDVTERKKAEEAFLKSEERYRTILQTAMDGYWLTDIQGNILDVNESYCKMSGYGKQELLAMRIGDIVVTENIVDISKRMQRIIQNGSERFDSRHRRKDGSILDLEVSVQYLAIEGDRIVSFFRDSSTRKKSENRYKMLFERLPVGMAMINHKTGAFLEANKSILRSTGYTREEFLKLTFWDITPEEYLQQENDQFKELNETEIFTTNEKEYIRKDGSRYPIALSGAKILDENGMEVVWGIIEDITERKKSEEKIKSLLAEKELLLKEVHHRIKNNMNTIGSLLSLQAQAVKEPSAISALEDAIRRVQSMGILYDKLYRSADFTEVSVKDYLPALVDEIKANFLNGQSVTVEKRIDDFLLDAKRLQPLGIIINELITNIMKYAFKGRVNGRIGISATKSEGHIVLSIRDNGVGMPESFAVENSTGFGLQLVHALTGQLEGTIRIERGNGTNFILEFEH